jgi:hypothetical protein
MTNNLCKCGCGKQVRLPEHTYIRGHHQKDCKNTLGKHWKLGKQSRENIGKGHIGVYRHPDGKIFTPRGYVRIYKGNIRRVYEHYLVIEQYFGRRPKHPEETHHVNGIKDDNRIQNLIVFKNRASHQSRFHRFGETKLKPGDIIFDGRAIKEDK